MSIGFLTTNENRPKEANKNGLWRLFYEDGIVYRASFLMPLEFAPDLKIHFIAEKSNTEICENMYHESGANLCDECKKPSPFAGKSSNTPKHIKGLLGYVFDSVGQVVLDRKTGKPKLSKAGNEIDDDPEKIIEIGPGMNKINFMSLQNENLTKDKKGVSQFLSYIWKLQKQGKSGLLPPQALKPLNFEDEFDTNVPKDVLNKYFYKNDPVVTVSDANGNSYVSETSYTDEEIDTLRVLIYNAYGNVRFSAIPNWKTVNEHAKAVVTGIGERGLWYGGLDEVAAKLLSSDVGGGTPDLSSTGSASNELG